MVEHLFRESQPVTALRVIATTGYGVGFTKHPSKKVSNQRAAVTAFHSHVTLVRSPTGDDYTTYWGTNAWDFLLFCAIWTNLTLVFFLSLLVAKSQIVSGLCTS